MNLCSDCNIAGATCVKKNIFIIHAPMEHTTGRWFFPVTPVSTTNKTDSHNITEIWLKVVFNTINQTKPTFSLMWDTNSLKIVREFVSEESNTQLNLRRNVNLFLVFRNYHFLHVKEASSNYEFDFL